MTTRNPVELLVEHVGKDSAQFLMGVHHNTLYKWLRDPSEGGRNPPAATRMLANVYLDLLLEEGWSLNKLTSIVERIDG